jgi:hypothetical protein
MAGLAAILAARPDRLRRARRHGDIRCIVPYLGTDRIPAAPAA